ncbi:hypothetical protein MMC18_006851 [Xylographa bjoerkii]|nr:hypothetical protein [Xylographa bjoerkii]
MPIRNSSLSFDYPNTFIELSSPSIQSYSYSYASPPTRDSSLYLTRRSGPYTFASEVSVFWDTVQHSDGTLTVTQGTIGPAGHSGYTNASTVTLNVYGTSGLASTGAVVPGPNAAVYYSNPRDAQDIATFIRGRFAALPAAALPPLNIPQAATLAQIVASITASSALRVGRD